MWRRLGRALRRPWDDTVGGLERALDRGAAGLALALVGLAAGWWLYVPVHELLHAAGCAAAGGTVGELQISPLYGGGLLARWLPWITAGGDYAGRLSGFDTGGSDAVYLATVAAPYLLTVFPGVWALRRTARRTVKRGGALLFGAALPVAFAPFVSLTGDAYEAGSILVTRLPPWLDRAELLRGDDLGRVAHAVAAAGGGVSSWTGMMLGFALGLIAAFGTYGLGSLLAGPPVSADGATGSPAGPTATTGAIKSRSRVSRSRADRP